MGASTANCETPTAVIKFGADPRAKDDLLPPHRILHRPLPVDRRRFNPVDIGLLIVAAGCLLLYARMALTGVGNTLYSDLHQFRQCQTAISCQWMLKHSRLVLFYETPVLGPPWSIPFEFPIYQWLACIVARCFWCRLEIAGRAVSILFHLATIPAFYIAAVPLGLPRDFATTAACLWLVSPFAAFWSRTFMIESTATCFGAWFAACMMHGSPGWLMAGVVCGALCGLVKVTTWPPYVCAIGLFAAFHRWPWQFPLAVASIAPALLWTRAADACKRLNPIARTMLVSNLPAHRQWMFGTWRERFSRANWQLFLSPARTGRLLAYWIPLLACIPFCRHWSAFAGCVVAALVSPILFPRLWFHHEYYAAAVAPLCLFAVALLIASLGWPAVAVMACGCYRLWVGAYAPMQHRDNHSLDGLVVQVNAQCPPDAVLLIRGHDWDSTIPYVTGRRALMIPNWPTLKQEDVNAAMKSLEGFQVFQLN